MNTDTPLTLPPCGRRVIPCIAQSSHYLQISHTVADAKISEFYENLSTKTRASSLLQSPISGFTDSYTIASPMELSELVMSIVQVAAEQAITIADSLSCGGSSSKSEDEPSDPRRNGCCIISKKIFHPAQVDSPEVYALCDASRDQGSPVPKIIVVCLPPWKYRARDLKEFVGRTMLCHEPVSRRDPNSPPTTAADVIWALTYDACIATGSSYFVVSTYQGWVLGNHRKNHLENRWEVSPIMKFNNPEPPVPKMLVQHFTEAFRHFQSPTLMNIPESETIPPSTDLEEDWDEIPLCFADVLKLGGFQVRRLAFTECIEG